MTNGGDAYLYSITEETDISSDGTNKGRVINHKGKSHLLNGKVLFRFTVTEDFPDEVETSQFQVLSGATQADQVLDNSPHFQRMHLKRGFTWEYIANEGAIERFTAMAINNGATPLVSGKVVAAMMPIFP